MVRPRTARSSPEAARPEHGRRSFGWVRELGSGNFQASYVVKGERIMAPTTFISKGDASAWLALRQSEIIEHRWKPAPLLEPEQVTFADYSVKWLAGRELSPKTRSEYQKILNGRLAEFDDLTLDQITPGRIKTWWNAQSDAHPTARRRAYELLRAILGTASRPDEDTDSPALIANNPARLTTRTLNGNRNRITSTTREPTPRTRLQPASLEELAAIMDAMPDRYRAMVLLAAWCAPRFGELTELRRRDLTITKDKTGTPVAGILHIVRAMTWPDADTPIVKEPKTDAGVRDVAIPPHLLPMLVEHVDKWAVTDSVPGHRIADLGHDATIS